MIRSQVGRISMGCLESGLKRNPVIPMSAQFEFVLGRGIAGLRIPSSWTVAHSLDHSFILGAAK